MVGYSLARKEVVLSKMLLPNNQTIAALSKSGGMAEATLYNWRQQARNAGRLLPDADATPEGWRSKDKFTAVTQMALMSEAEIAEHAVPGVPRTDLNDAIGGALY